MDFLCSKFYGIAWACSCALSWSFAHLPHMGLPRVQKLVKFGTNWVQTLRNAYLWNRWMDLQPCQPLRILHSHYAFRVSKTPLSKPVQNMGKLRILRNFGAIRPIPRNLQQLSRLAVSRKTPAGQNIDKGLVYFTITICFGVRFRHPINKGSCRGETMPNET